jgi:hypothetical protein
VSDNTEWESVLDLSGASRDLLLGVEVGMLYVSVRVMAEGSIPLADGTEVGAPRIDAVEMTVHGENAEMFIRLAERFGVRIRSEELDETWMKVFYWKDRDEEDRDI